jgi:hypothetical protein
LTSRANPCTIGPFYAVSSDQQSFGSGASTEIRAAPRGVKPAATEPAANEKFLRSLAAI